jgi:hypothetical protein
LDLQEVVLGLTVFERAGDARKVLCVALDYAKRKHVALICDGNGDVLKSSFPVENNSAGIAHLIKEITSTARRRKIPKEQIFLGGEDEAAYVANFTEALRTKGYLVVRVNAYEAKENRENLLASTDTLDLLGIAKTLLSRRARSTGGQEARALERHKPAAQPAMLQRPRQHAPQLQAAQARVVRLSRTWHP